LTDYFVVSGVFYITGVVEAPSGLQARDKVIDQGAIAFNSIRYSFGYESVADELHDLEVSRTAMHMNGIHFENGSSAAYYFEPNDVQRERERQAELEIKFTEAQDD